MKWTMHYLTCWPSFVIVVCIIIWHLLQGIQFFPTILKHKCFSSPYFVHQSYVLSVTRLFVLCSWTDCMQLHSGIMIVCNWVQMQLSSCLRFSKNTEGRWIKAGVYWPHAMRILLLARSELQCEWERGFCSDDSGARHRTRASGE